MNTYRIECEFRNAWNKIELEYIVYVVATPKNQRSQGARGQKGKKNKNHIGKFLHDNIARRKWRFVNAVKPMSINKQWKEDEHNKQLKETSDKLDTHARNL